MKTGAVRLWWIRPKYINREGKAGRRWCPCQYCPVTSLHGSQPTLPALPLLSSCCLEKPKYCWLREYRLIDFPASLKKCLLCKMCLGPILPDLSIGNTPYYFVYCGPRVASNNALSHWMWGPFLGELIDCAHAQLPVEDDRRSFSAQLQIFEAKETATSQS